MQIFGSGQSHVKIWFFEMSKAIPVSIWNEFISKNVAKEALDRSSWILDADHWFSSKSHQNMIFWNVKSYSCINLKWVHPINVAKEALDRNSWIFDADHWSVQSHVKIWFLSKAMPVSIWNDFNPIEMSKAIPVSIWNEFTQ